jgi:apolipoprotein N-acyltransferase
LDILDQLGQTRWLLTAQSSEGISTPMLVALVVCLAVIAGCAGVFAPRHRTMLVVALLCAISVSGTIFLLIELYEPFGGVMRMSHAPLQTAIADLSQPLRPSNSLSLGTRLREAWPLAVSERL